MEEDESDPTDVLQGVKDIADITENVLDSGTKIAVFFSKIQRQCEVQINNETSKYTLRNPSVHTDTGICAEPLDISIYPSSSGKGFFTKSSLRGSGAVFTYDLYHSQRHECVEKMAVLFKIPYDLNLKSIVFAIGLFDIDTKCDKHLFHSMFKGSEDRFVRAKANGSCITFKSNSVTITANMSNCGKAVMKIEVK